MRSSSRNFTKAFLLHLQELIDEEAEGPARKKPCISELEGRYPQELEVHLDGHLEGHLEGPRPEAKTAKARKNLRNA